MEAAFLKEGYILFLKGWCPMKFELLLEVTDHFLNLRETNAGMRPIALLHTCTNQTVPYGTRLQTFRTSIKLTSNN
jgi:hypothetical protein